MVDTNDRGLPPTPPTGDSGDEPRTGGQLPHNPEAEDAPLTVRKGRNPANLGDEVPEMGDITYPTLDPQPAEI
jgi:hypothetical protein